MQTIGVGLLESKRRCQGLSATTLAARMGVSRSSVSQVERGLQEPSQAFKAKAAAALDAGIADLWPEWFLIVREKRRTASALELIHDRDGKIVAFSTSRRAAGAVAALRRRSIAGISVRGPIGPTGLAILLGVAEDETPDRLLVDPAPKSLNFDGAAPHKSGAAQTRAGLARDASG